MKLLKIAQKMVLGQSFITVKAAYKGHVCLKTFVPYKQSSSYYKKGISKKLQAYLYLGGRGEGAKPPPKNLEALP